MPRPACCVKSVTGASCTFICSAYFTIACASGCSEYFSSDAAVLTSSASPALLLYKTSVTPGSPCVMVPVLSSTMVLTSCTVSNASADLIKTPLAAPRPVPTIIAVGVASPSAHGQLITSTAIALESANSKLSPSKSHTAAVTSAIPITAGTNTPLTLSAILAMGGLELVASSTSLTICASVVSSPTLSARILKKPDFTTVAPVTLLPVSFSTGMLSPVIADSSTAACPSVKTPSTGTLMPLRTTRISPFSTSSTGISSSAPSRSTTAVFGAKSISFVIASLVLPLARASRNLPKVISVKIIPADSKYKSIENRCTSAKSPCPKP